MADDELNVRPVFDLCAAATRTPEQRQLHRAGIDGVERGGQIGNELVGAGKPDLGVVHAKDGVEGTRARIVTASRYAPLPFGVATECGMARARSEETVRTLLKIHAAVCGDA